MTRQFTVIVEREDDGYVAWCPALDIASQGDTVEAARANLSEALDLFFEYASSEEVAARMKNDLFITQVEVALG
jgi:predicted RNase H-like HicB family nuclease